MEDGDDDFTLFVRSHKRELHNMCVLYLKDHHEAEDAVQETFLKAWKARGRRRAGGSGHTWLITICRNECIDRWRRRPNGGPPRSFDEEGHIEPCDPHSVEDDDRRIDLRKAVNALSTEQFETWNLFALGYTSDDAADIVDVPASTIRSRRARVLEVLAAALCEKPRLAGAWVTANVCGLYHSSSGNAIVVSLATPSQCGGMASVRRQSYLRMYDDLAARPAKGSTAHGTAPCPNLFEFLARVDGDGPRDRAVLALVETTTADAAVKAKRWGAAHPQWTLHSMLDHRTWQRAVEELFADQANARHNHGPRGMLALIDAAAPFAWIDHQNGSHR